MFSTCCTTQTPTGPWGQMESTKGTARAGEALTEPLVIIYWQFWLTGKVANVIPIYMRGWKEDPGNYSLTDLIFYDKVTTQILSTQTLVKPLTSFPRAFSWRSWLLMVWTGTLLLGQKLPGWPGPEGGGEWCYIQLVASHQWCSPGLSSGASPL